MKVSLVVASGAQKGRVISLTGPEFLIGRDQECDLRAASLAISKRHCALNVRDGKVYLKDLGSTNGTFVNDVMIQDAAVGIQDGALLRVGPLAFRIRIEVFVPRRDETPLPTGRTMDPLVLKTSSATAAKTSGPPSQRVQPAASTPPKPVPARAAPAPKSGITPSLTSPKSGVDDNVIAEALRVLEEVSNESAPEGGPVTDAPVPVPSAAAGDPATGAEAGEKKDGKAKTAQTREEMTNVAENLLRRYTRRRK